MAQSKNELGRQIYESIQKRSEALSASERLVLDQKIADLTLQYKNLDIVPVAAVSNVALDEMLSVGTYRMTVDLDLAGIAIEWANKQLLGTSAEKVLQDLANVQKEMVLPIAGKRVRFIAFKSSELVPVLSKRWEISFELLENPVPVVAILSGLAVVAGILAVYMTFRSIEKISDNVASGVTGVATDLGMLVLVGAGLFFGFKYGLPALKKIK